MVAVYRNGASAEYASLQAAVDAGGDIFLPPGEYTVGDSGSYLSMGSNTRLRGAGMGMTILLDARTVSNPTPPQGVVGCAGGANVAVEDLTIERRTETDPPSGLGFKAVSFTGTIGSPIENARIVNVETIDILGENLYVDGYCTGVLIEGCRVRRPGKVGFTGQGINTNITSSNAKGCRVIGNLIDGEGGGLVSQAFLLNGDNISCVGNQVLNMGVAGGGDVINFAQSHGFTFVGNTISGCDISAAAASVIRMGLNHNSPNEETSGVIVGNTFTNNTLGTIAGSNVVHVQRSAGPVVIQGNMFRNNHPSSDPGGNSAVTPSVVYVTSDEEYTPNVLVSGNAFFVGSGGTAGDIYGVRIDGSVPAASCIEVANNNRFSPDWPQTDRVVRA